MQGILAIFFPPETTAQNTRFEGTFENSIGYVYQEKHVPVLGKICKNKAARTIREIKRVYPILIKLN